MAVAMAVEAVEGTEDQEVEEDSDTKSQKTSKSNRQKKKKKKFQLSTHPPSILDRTTAFPDDDDLRENLQFKEARETDEIDSKFGYDRLDSTEMKLGWLLNMCSVSAACSFLSRLYGDSIGFLSIRFDSIQFNSIQFNFGFCLLFTIGFADHFLSLGRPL